MAAAVGGRSAASPSQRRARIVARSARPRSRERRCVV